MRKIEEDKERLEVYAVGSGACLVRMSSISDSNSINYEL